ncbi:MAG: PilZ domain-containing protein [Myxococcota bacterium]|nr:PilZ domain-containing protein [Myxococcota bacterium]
MRFESRDDFEQVYLHDLPGGGVFVPTDKAYGLGDMVSIKLCFPEIPEGIQLRGRVVWRRPATRWRGSLQPGVGISLEKAEPEKIQFLVRYCEGRLEARRGKSRRIPVDFDVDFSTSDNWYRGKATNISREGIFIATDAPVLVGETLILRFFIDKSAPPDQCYGRVVWQSARSSEAGIGVELEYKTAHGKQQIYNFVKRIEESLIQRAE